MTRSVEELLREALLHFDAAAAYAVREITDPQMVADAIAMRLFAGLEALVRLPNEFADDLFRDSWPDMRGLRHRMAHGYGTINATRLRATIAHDLPSTVDLIRDELATRKRGAN